MIVLRFKIRKKRPLPPYPMDCGLIRLAYEIEISSDPDDDGPYQVVGAEIVVPEGDEDDAVLHLRRDAFAELAAVVETSGEEEASDAW